MGVNKPSIGSVHVDVALSNFSVGYHNGGFVADIVAPIVDVIDETGIYFEWGFESFYPEETHRAIGTWANEVRFEPTKKTYSVEEDALRSPIPDRVKNAADPVLRLQQKRVMTLKDKVYLSREIRVRDMFLTGGFSSTTLAGATRWDQYTSATSDPLGNINTGIQTVRRGIWRRPTHILIPPDVAEILALHPDILDLLKYTHSDLLTNYGLPTMIRGLKVIVPEAGYTGSSVSTTPSDVWGDNVVILFINPNPGIDDLNTISTFTTRRGRVRVFREEGPEVDSIEFSVIMGEKIIALGGAYVIKDVLT